MSSAARDSPSENGASPCQSKGKTSAPVKRAVSEMKALVARPWLTASAFVVILIVHMAAPPASTLFMKDSLDSISVGAASRSIFGVALLILTYILEALTETASTWLRLTVHEQLAAGLRVKFVHRAMRMPFSGYEQLSKGDIVSRLTADVNESSGIFTAIHYIIEVITRAAGAIAVLIFLGKELSVMVLGFLFAFTALNARLSKSLRTATKEYQGSLGGLSAYALGAIEGITVIKSFLAEKRMGAGFSARAEAVGDKSMAIGKRTALLLFMGILGAFSTLLLCFGYGARMAVSGRITFGSMLAMFMLTDSITPLSFLGERLAALHRCSGAYERVREIMEAGEDADIYPQPGSLPGRLPRLPWGAPAAADVIIDVRGLSYEYVPGMRALNGVSFDVRRGQKVAVVGRSGCGKSTLMKILAGLYRPEPGTVFVDGQDMAYHRLSGAREKVTYVPQEPFMFAGSFWDNLSLGYKDGLTDAPTSNNLLDVPEIRGALELSDALEVVMSKDNGLEAEVGERGSLLSGGQRQRLCLARGFLRGTPVLLLDEPTSSVDEAAETRILVGLAAKKGLTCLVVTHRFSVAETVDRIIVMDEGRITEAGTHDELLQNPGLYWSLFTGKVSFTSSPPKSTELQAGGLQP